MHLVKSYFSPIKMRRQIGLNLVPITTTVNTIHLIASFKDLEGNKVINGFEVKENTSKENTSNRNFLRHNRIGIRNSSLFNENNHLNRINFRNRAYFSTVSAKLPDNLAYESNPLKHSRKSFRIPVPLNPEGIVTIPNFQTNLIKHAVDTYNGVGNKDFDSNVEHIVECGSDIGILPLSTDLDVRLRYITHRNSVRYGMLLEKLDMFATWIGYKHNQDPNVEMSKPAHHTIGVVTALVDQIEVHQEALPSSEHDIFYYGYTTWVGKSSSEVVIQVQQKYSENDIRELLTAKFIMVTLGIDGKAAPNIRLAIESQDEIDRFKEAEHAKKIRQYLQKKSLAKLPPTHEEIFHLHQLNQKVTDPHTLSLERNLISHPEYAFMDAAIYNTSMICFPFQKNLHRQIFGGYLMRKAYEAAFTNASMFSNSTPQFVFGGDMTFHKAVDIGAVVYLNSQVCYTKNNHIHVLVRGKSINKKTNQLQTVNTFRYTFKVDNEIPSIIPTSYADGLRYLAAKRHFEIYIEKNLPKDFDIEIN